MTTKQQGIYKKTEFKIGAASGVTLSNRCSDKIIPVRHNVPCNIIVIHGVNDVGTAYAAVERGLCEGLSARLAGDLRAADYTLPTAAGNKKLEDDPDAVYYKRTITDSTLSPVIPFYWGFRENPSNLKKDRAEKCGQKLDRHGNRLDKDLSKGGGPFANATSTLPDMWNRGKWGVFRMLDRFQEDATHPVLNCPGRMYMVLAARRLAALICMIRDYDENETVSIVAHSQGCLISLLAQAFLLDPKFKALQANARPADTLILNNPPYSLIDDVPMLASVADGYTDADDEMRDRYFFLDGVQTLNGRLTTLKNIVRGVWANKHSSPPLGELNNTKKHYGAVGPCWSAERDRDNRGKVYLYFGPEDMTVALVNVQGIGWQGVPRFQRGKRVSRVYGRGLHTTVYDIVRPALSELGEGFRQRVFTMKRRPNPVTGEPVQVGAAGSPYDFVLRVRGEDDKGHTAVSDSFGGRHARGHLPATEDAHSDASVEERQSHGVRQINGEALKNPVLASLLEGSSVDAQGRPGSVEDVDPIDAAISITSEYGLATVWQCISHETPQREFGRSAVINSPHRDEYDGKVGLAGGLAEQIAAILNANKNKLDQVEVLHAYVCLNDGFTQYPIRPGKVLIQRYESPNEARLRWQRSSVPRSFHGAIFGGKENHRNVTAYDVAIGGGNASSDPLFYRYLCAVADWRLQKVANRARPNVLQWSKFQRDYSSYFLSEPTWRQNLIEGSADYYSSGILPRGLPVVPEELPPDVISELKA